MTNCSAHVNLICYLYQLSNFHLLRERFIGTINLWNVIKAIHMSVSDKRVFFVKNKKLNFVPINIFFIRVYAHNIWTNCFFFFYKDLFIRNGHISALVIEY